MYAGMMRIYKHGFYVFNRNAIEYRCPVYGRTIEKSQNFDYLDFVPDLLDRERVVKITLCFLQMYMH